MVRRRGGGVVGPGPLLTLNVLLGDYDLSGNQVILHPQIGIP